MTSPVKRHSLATFFVLAYGLSWGNYILSATWPNFPFLHAGALAPPWTCPHRSVRRSRRREDGASSDLSCAQTANGVGQYIHTRCCLPCYRVYLLERGWRASGRATVGGFDSGSHLSILHARSHFRRPGLAYRHGRLRVARSAGQSPDRCRVGMVWVCQSQTIRQRRPKQQRGGFL